METFKKDKHLKGRFTQIYLKELETLGTPSFISSSGSKYWETENHIYRLSNHWGSCGKSFFEIKGKINAPKNLKLGIIKRSDLHEICYLDLTKYDIINEILDMSYNLKFSIKSHLLSSKLLFFVILKHSAIKGYNITYKKRIKLGYSTIWHNSVIENNYYIKEHLYYKKKNEKIVDNYIKNKIKEYKLKLEIVIKNSYKEVA